jgi:predicted metal-dependent hydrolase
MLDPDDDGTGLNGLGFRPTATQQVARSQRRRKQVLEWKARQAREERERRAQKRRELEHIGAASVGMQKMEDHAGGAGAKKVVRFAV